VGSTCRQRGLDPRRGVGFVVDEVALKQVSDSHLAECSGPPLLLAIFMAGE
jgi:hypothetical protein